MKRLRSFFSGLPKRLPNPLCIGFPAGLCFVLSPTSKTRINHTPDFNENAEGLNLDRFSANPSEYRKLANPDAQSNSSLLRSKKSLPIFTPLFPATWTIIRSVLQPRPTKPS